MTKNVPFTRGKMKNPPFTLGVTKNVPFTLGVTNNDPFILGMINRWTKTKFYGSLFPGKSESQPVALKNRFAISFLL